MKIITLILLSLFFSLSFAQEIGARYLIIAHDNFYNAILPYAQWKHKMGLCTKIVRVPSQLAQNSTSIRNYIIDAYYNWQMKPEFILFVGAPNYIPWSFSSYPYGDNNYTNMDANIYNEILSGRLTVHSTTEAQTVVAKMLRYDRYPDLMDSIWLKKGCLIVNDYPNGHPDDDSMTYRLDAQYVAGLMVSNGYAKVDTFFATRGANATSVINATNDGRGFVLYRGTATNNWYSPFAVYPDNLANGNKLPIVISATCGTLGTGSTSATAERWFLTGSPTTLRGAAGYFATTTSITNGAYLRSAVTRGFFDGVFSYKRRTFGEACEDGRIKVYNSYGATNEYKGFTTVGDPAMTIWTAVPKIITVSYDSILYAGIDETLQVNVQYQGASIESAYVCIMFDTLIYQTGWTNTSGSVSFIFNAPNPGVMDITVTGKNLYPFEDSITISYYHNVMLVYTGNIIQDSLGNNNGNVDPGETILLWAKIKNMGVSTAQGVSALLRTDDTMVVITDSISRYANIESGCISQGLNPFVFTVSPKTIEHLIPFELIMCDSNDSIWTANFTIVTTGSSGGNNGTGPDSYGYYIYDDTDTETGNAPIYVWFEVAPSAGGPGFIIPEISDSDDDTATYSLPFNFTFYGINYSTLGLCSNGFLELSTPTYTYGDNTQIPLIGGPKILISPFWDDFDLSPEPVGGGEVYYYNDTINHRFIVEYKDCRHYGPIPWTETFQIILLDPAYYPTPTGDGEILIMYNTVTNPNSCTVGIEDETETRGLQYVYNNSYDVNAEPMISGRALLVTTKPPISQHSPWINLINYTINDSSGGNNNGIPEPGETIELVIMIKNDGDTMVSNVTGILGSNSLDISILDSIADFGDLAIGASSDNNSNPYILEIANTPSDTLVGLSVYLSGNDGNYHTYAYLTLRIHNETGIEEVHKENGIFPVLQTYPNPFRNHLIIKFQIPKNYKTDQGQGFPDTLRLASGSLAIYDVCGRVVRNLSRSTVNGEQSTIVWSGEDDSGRQLPSGIYFVVLKYDNLNETEKTILLK